MALVPRRVKHMKEQRGKLKGNASRGTELAFGSYGLKTLEPYWITSRQIEASRKAVIRYLKKGGKFWIRIFPDKPVTKKGSEIPMGGGKGAVDHYVAPVKPGRILFELEGISKEKAREAFSRASDKLPVKTKFIFRNE